MTNKSLIIVKIDNIKNPCYGRLGSMQGGYYIEV